MSLKKLWTALKGGSNEVMETMADSQSIRIMDQEMREAKEELIACDHNLTKIMAKRKLTENKVRALEADIETYTTHALAASEKSDDTLALECAEKVAEVENMLEVEKGILDGFLSSEKSLKSSSLPKAFAI